MQQIIQLHWEKRGTVNHMRVCISSDVFNGIIDTIWTFLMIYFCFRKEESQLHSLGQVGVPEEAFEEEIVVTESVVNIICNKRFIKPHEFLFDGALIQQSYHFHIKLTLNLIIHKLDKNTTPFFYIQNLSEMTDLHLNPSTSCDSELQESLTFISYLNKSGY